ncbi:pili assembly chaperone [Deinococcus piscis]|uniref:Pili assembly chaperone n=1 Tax=Deinococcus piscis TaxID=394230 RepID=A0ABQ3K5B5_9DEIO|nr:prepilin-type N-terminal cleavage/methylation domain-containing protein [Deinococcus piscis]GHG04438.1 pili assembly chaperone [Deinococcus piscis]
MIQSLENHRQAGFSLIEVLVVMAILGILLSMGIVNYIRNVQAAEVRDAAALITSQLRQARAQAQKDSVDMKMSWNAAGQYGLGPASASSTMQALPKGVQLRCKTSCEGSSVTFGAPFGELRSATGTVFELVSPYEGIRSYEVRLVGVTGKAMMVPVTP